MKIAAGIEYRGTCFSGWQRQHHAPSIQEHVEEALSRIADHKVITVCAGRTDTGVHAIQQVIHFETSAYRPDLSWILGGNAHMQSDVCLRWVKHVDDSFHARFSALSRSYRYVILNRKFRPGITHGLVTWEHRMLDTDLMSRAALHLIGTHDFSSFRAVACQAKNPMRQVRRLDVYRADPYVLIEIEANAFLHHMVRNIAGVLIAIGKKERDPNWALQVLHARDRNQGGITAPPDGLYLVDVAYPSEFGIPVPEQDSEALPPL